MNSELNFALQMFVDRFTKQTGEAPSLDVMNDFLQAQTSQMNSRPKDSFDGLSPDQMFRLNYKMWGEDSPIVLNELSNEDLAQIPIFRQVEKLTSILLDKGKIKLTTTGTLPMAIVREIYSVGTPDWYLEGFRSSRIIENDSESVQRTRMMLSVMQVIKVRKGDMTLTARGKKLIADRQQFLSEMIQNFCSNINWAYFDGYDNEDIGQIGVGFSLVMVAKYGDNWLRTSFYAEKYFKAFSMLQPSVARSNEDVVGENCYKIRTFTRFMQELGIIEIREEKIPVEMPLGYKYFDIKYDIKRTELFDKIFMVKL